VAGEIKDGVLRIGNTTVPIHAPATKLKVPDVLFYENAQVMTSSLSGAFVVVHFKSTQRGHSSSIHPSVLTSVHRPLDLKLVEVDE